MTFDDFKTVWVVDYEFKAAPGGRPEPVCLVAHEVRSGQTLHLWRDQWGQTCPYDIGPDSLLVAYYASAEMGCHLALNWPLPANVLDLYAEFRRGTDGDKEQINDDIVFEIELIKQVEINVDYILMLVQKYRDERGDGDDKEIRAEISRAIDSSPSLRNKKDLIEDFVDSLSVDGEIDQEWRAFIAAKRGAELEAIITEENLRPDETRVFVETAFRDGQIRTSGTAITQVLPPVSRFAADGGHGEKKQRVLAKLGEFFERFFGLSSGGDN